MGDMERALTVRQRRFAAGVASGLSKAKAYALAYQGNNMKRSTLETTAKKAAKNPQVKAEIERLTLELLPPVEDMKRAYQHALATIVRLTIETPDDRLRFDCARWLLTECQRQEQLTQRQEQLPEKAAPERTEAIMADLRRLYEMALGPRDAENPLVLEVDLRSEEAITHTPPLAPSQLAADTAVDEAVEADGGHADCETHLDSPESEPMFRRELIPGRFPPTYRRVRIR
jgi:hypothetical protein